MSKFLVLNVAPPDRGDIFSELEGAIDKYWLDLPNLGRSLVKADLRGAWVEKVAQTLAKTIGLPVAHCELAERSDGLKLIVSPSFLQREAIERSGEKLLMAALGANYFYTPEAILSVLDSAGILLPSTFTAESPIATASDLMVGYLMFDSWIGNIDRHAKNWGIQQTLDGRKELLPTYDHGLSLGVQMPEDKLPLDLTDFSGDCRSSLLAEVGGVLSMNALAHRLLELKPEVARFWIDRIGKIERSTIEEIFSRLPESWTSADRTAFAMDLLEKSRERLLSIVNTRSGNCGDFD